MALLALLYYLLAQAVAGVFSDRQLPILIWPSSGLALAALLGGRIRLWPGIFLGALVDGIAAGLPLWMCLYEVMGKTLSAVSGAFLLKRWLRVDLELTQPRDYLWLALAGSLGATLSAFTGATALMWEKQLALQEAASLFLKWWQGDTLGILLVAPIMMVWKHLPAGWFGPDRAAETVCCFGLSWLAGQAIFLGWFQQSLGPYTYNYWMFLFVAWAAVRYGRHGALLVSTVTAIQALSGAISNRGGFAHDIVETGLLNLWFFMFALTTVGLMLALILHNLEQAQTGLAEAKRAAESASRLKGEFLANMSHEIRTPMNAILGLSHLALKTSLTPKQLDYLTKIQSSARSLLTLINDILDVSKIEAGRLDIERVPFHLSQVLDSTAAMMSLKAEEKGLELIFRVAKGTPLGLVGDPFRLGQVLLNLTSNAIKFTERGEVTVTVEITTVLDQTAHLRFSVSDSGIGLSQEQQEKIFNAFTQADGSTSRKYGGTGLGLSISKQLVTLMGGQISLESAPGVGSTFTFTLPLGLDSSVSSRQFQLPPGLEAIRVLVVDDNEIARETLEDELSAMRFSVTTVASGRAAISELVRAHEALEHPYDLVLLDWKMPEMDGLETARRIKSDLHLPKPPTIFVVTGDGRDEIRFQAETLGLKAFLLKPVNPSILFDHIVAAFAGSAIESARRSEADLSLNLLTGARVLVTEDNSINQQVIRELLERMGAQVEIASSGREALEILASDSHFDVVLMDVQMPGMGGYEATQRIRDQLKNTTLPVIAVTAHALEAERQKCLAAGMNDHVAKPIEPLELLSTMLKWIDPQRLQATPAVEAPAQDLGWPDLPGMDVPAALRRVSGSSTLLRNLLEEFRSSWKEAPAQLQSAIDQQQYDEAMRLAHTLVGVSATLCMKDVAQAAGSLEAHLKVPEIPPLPAALQRLERALQVVLAGLAQLPEPEPPGPEPEGSDPTRVAALVEELSDLLREQNFEATEHFALLQGQLGDGPWRETLKQLQHQVDGLDFASAQATLEQLKGEL